MMMCGVSSLSLYLFIYIPCSLNEMILLALVGEHRSFGLAVRLFSLGLGYAQVIIYVLRDVRISQYYLTYSSL